MIRERGREEARARKERLRRPRRRKRSRSPVISARAKTCRNMSNGHELRQSVISAMSRMVSTDDGDGGWSPSIVYAMNPVGREELKKR